ncbi:MAG: hypothetical protein GXO48_02675 [Chlorobi bacterium]|nr:hypothetical protein [Chlorobiota bacterium]
MFRLCCFLLIISLGWAANGQSVSHYKVIVSCPQQLKDSKEPVKCKYDTVMNIEESTHSTHHNKIFEREGRYYRIVSSCPAQPKESNKPTKCSTDTIEITKDQYYFLTKKDLLPDGVQMECEKTPKSEGGEDKCYIVLPDGTHRELKEYIQSRLRAERK